ncbi:MAG: nitrite/sulfite reductase [Campylobacteraceae bacterium]|nr:nitrite/sulfite reductase [Campylobacteraceae bacterium]
MEKELSKVEILKASRPPLKVIDDIYIEAEGGVPLSGDYIGLLKWYGMYPHINHGKTEDKNYFMKRVKLVDASMNLEQLRVMGEIGEKYAQGLIDFTTRENIQFHYIEIKDLPAIFDLMKSVGLTSRMASGDGPRPIVACPVAGLDIDEIYDATHLVKEVDTYFDQNSDQYSNFPRKYKLGISGCKCACTPYEIQDIAFRAFKQNDEVLFDLTVGGGLSKSKQIAYRAKRYVKIDQVKDVAVVCSEIFRDHGNRQSRSKARVRHLVNDWGLEKFVAEIETRLGYTLMTGEVEPEVESFENRNHLGINKAVQKGESYIGFATNAGRVAGSDFVKMYHILKKYDAKGMRLTTTQNFVVFGVKDEVAQNIADEIDALGYPYEPTIFRARMQSCTGSEFCKFGITETKTFTQKVILELEEKFPNFEENIMISISGCVNACSHPQISDIGFIGCKVKNDEGKRVEGYEIHYGGNLKGEKSSVFATPTGIKIPATKVTDHISDLITQYQEDPKDTATFKEYIAAIPIDK